MTAIAIKRTYEPPGERTFIVDMADATDGVMRVLETFIIAGAHLTRLDLRREGEAIHLRVSVSGLDEIRADRVRGRLTVLHGVHGVASGWIS